MIDLEAIRERLEKATPGPWRHETRGGAGNSIYGPTETHYFEGHDGYRPLATAQECTASSKLDEQRANQQANIDLIAHAPTDIKALVEEVERLREGFAEYIYQTTNTSVPSAVGGREYRNAMIPYSAIKDARDLVRQEPTP